MISEETGNVHPTSLHGKTSFCISVILNVYPNGIIHMVLSRLLGYMVANMGPNTPVYLRCYHQNKIYPNITVSYQTNLFIDICLRPEGPAIRAKSGQPSKHTSNTLPLFIKTNTIDLVSLVSAMAI